MKSMQSQARLAPPDCRPPERRDAPHESACRDVGRLRLFRVRVEGVMLRGAFREGREKRTSDKAPRHFAGTDC